MLAVASLLTPVVVGGPAVGLATEQSLSELLNQLEHPREACARTRAAEALAKYGERAVPPLRRLLQHSDAIVRDYACMALVRLAPRAEAAVPDLIEIAGNSAASDNLRESAILALGQIGPAASPAVPVLQAALGEPRPELRRRAVSALAAIATPEAVEILIELLQQGEPKEQQVILFAFCGQGARARFAAKPLLDFGAEHIDGDLCERVFLTVASFGREAAPELVPYLRADRLETRRRAALALSRLGPDAAEAVPMLCETLNDEETLMRFWAAKALGSIGPGARQATASLLRLLDDEDPNVRWEATAAFAKIDLAAIKEQEWNRLLSDSDPGVRRQAATLRAVTP
jgi:HEAT repeat protein